jgi:hypothetical protein
MPNVLNRTGWVAAIAAAGIALGNAPAIADEDLMLTVVKLEVNLWETVAALTYHVGWPDHENSDHALARYHDDVADFNTYLDALSTQVGDDLMPLYQTIYDDWGALMVTANNLLAGGGAVDFTDFRTHALWDQANVLDDRIEELIAAIRE